MNNSLNVPRLVIAAPQSGSGKTTLTCGILEIGRASCRERV